LRGKSLQRSKAVATLKQLRNAKARLYGKRPATIKIKTGSGWRREPACPFPPPIPSPERSSGRVASPSEPPQFNDARFRKNSFYRSLSVPLLAFALIFSRTAGA